MQRITVVLLWLFVISCGEASAGSPASKTSSAFASDLEDIAKLEKKEDVVAFWRSRGWYAVPTKSEDLVARGVQIPDPKLYPFVEQYEVHIWFEAGTHDGFLRVFVDKSGRVTYRIIEIVNSTPMTEPNKASEPTAINPPPSTTPPAPLAHL